MAGTRRILLASALVAVLLGAAALLVFRGLRFAAFVPEPSACGSLWQRGVELAGTVGGRESRAYFDDAQVAGHHEQLSGIVVFPDQRANGPLADAPIGLAGSRGQDACAVEVTERDSDTGAAWSLRIEDSLTHIVGQRRLPDGRRESVVFAIVPQMPCDGAGEWRTFKSSDWPITFQYPGSWSVTSDGDDITVECPSVTQLAFGGAWLTFEQGRFPQAEPFWFVKVGDDDWRVSDEGCATPPADAMRACRPARRSEHHSLTILQAAAGEHRRHRTGIGYLGPGPGITRYLFILGDQWVSLDDATSIAPRRDLGRDRGPVRLDGAGVGERVVRSIRGAESPPVMRRSTSRP